MKHLVEVGIRSNNTKEIFKFGFYSSLLLFLAL